ncbi:Proteasome inhibitor PI31 subunit [Trichoplax sp. H2]|nr:Proteasome inhibitor PI31 subunit [Trichoplax sp. H2]|eukprot:RDD36884.1 Proteasome inhibitor PI31 subunit [Trichoplax sp. H2]
MSEPIKIINKLFISSTITSPLEAAYIAFHASLIASGFQCIGLGDESAANEDIGTDNLPSEWNKTDVFALRYKNKSDRKLLVKALAIDRVLAINALNAEEDVANISIDVKRHVENDQDFSTAKGENVYKELSELLEILTTFISQKLQADNKPHSKNVPHRYAGSTTATRQVPPSRPPIYPEDDPLRIGPMHVPRPSYQQPFFNPDGDRIPCMGGGSMLFDPLRSGGIRPPNSSRRFPPENMGAVPPGARYDPVGPFGFDPSGHGPRRGEGVNLDHLPPPGFGSGFDPFI